VIAAGRSLRVIPMTSGAARLRRTSPFEASASNGAARAVIRARGDYGVSHSDKEG